MTKLDVLLLLGVIVLLVFPFLGGMGAPELAIWLVVLAGVIYLAVRRYRERRVTA